MKKKLYLLLISILVFFASHSQSIDNVVIANPVCGLNNGSILVNASGDTPPLEYSISDGIFQNNNSFTGLAPGIYDITITDALGRFSRSSVVLAEDPELEIVIFASNAFCFGDNGSVNITSLGGRPPYQYSINNQTSIISTSREHVFENLAPGFYNVTVQDANNCSVVSQEFVISSPSPLTSTANTVNILTCDNGATDGLISVSTTGGIPPYQYIIEPLFNQFTNSSDFAITEANTYTLIVRDSNGCLTQQQIVIEETPITPTVSLNQSNATLSVNIANAEYQWLDCNTENTPIFGATNQQFQPISNGSYAVSIKKQGCTEISDCFLFSTLSSNVSPTNLITSIFPNPVLDFVNINLDRSIKFITVNLLDITGKIIQTQNYANTSHISWHLNVAKGIYFIETVSKDSRDIHKLIKL